MAAEPIAPPIVVASVANAITGLPLTLPRAGMAPEASFSGAPRAPAGASGRSVPGSNSVSSRTAGSRKLRGWVAAGRSVASVMEAPGEVLVAVTRW